MNAKRPTAAGVRGLTLKYPGAKARLFDKLDLSIAAGERVLLLGPSGSGKSTLMQVLAGLIPRALDIPMVAQETVLPRAYGYVFQDPDAQFVMPHVDEELAFALENIATPREAMPREIARLLETVGLVLDDVHRPIATLSGGMKQRLAIAGALALDPEVLFLDEPTALLDPEGTARVFETIAKIASGRTLVIVEHNIEQALPLVERLIVLDERGRIALDGDVARTFARAKADLLRYGVWYPGAWEDMKRLRPPLPPPEIGGSPRLEIADFAGYIGREAKIVIERATVRPGEWIAITGPNGAGKSTLLYALRGLIRTSGTYRIDGRPATQTDLTRMFGFVFQNPEFQFVAQTVAAEIGYTPAALGEPPARVQSCVASALDAYRLGPYRTRHPFHLSLGQKRRLSVAAATAHAPPLWLLDEPTFGQDAQNAFALLDAIEHAREHGAAILMVTHDRRIVRDYATREWVIEAGRLVRDLPAPRLCEAAGGPSQRRYAR